jgi:hypothetical protein
MRNGILASALVLCVAGAAGADDLTIGGDARAFAMGGAGIATSGTADGATRNNVASLAFDKGNVRVYAPNLGIRAQGAVRQQRGLDYLLGLGSLGQAAKLVRDYGNRDSTFAVNASAGVRVGHLEILTNAVGTGTTKASGSNTDVTVDGVYNFPSIGFAAVVPGQKGRMQLAVGGRVKYANVVHSRLIVDSNGNATPAPEMNGRETDTKQGIAGDLGLMLKERDGGPLSLGLAVTNAIKPKAPVGGATFLTTASLGAGYVKKNVTVAVDLVDLTRTAGDTQLRAGAEVKAGPLPLRAGYSSLTGVTYGTRLFGVDLAFSRKQPLEIGSSIRF